METKQNNEKLFLNMIAIKFKTTPNEKTLQLIRKQWDEGKVVLTNKEKKLIGIEPEEAIMTNQTFKSIDEIPLDTWITIE